MASAYNSEKEPYIGCGYSTHAEIATLKNLKRCKNGKNKYWEKGRLEIDILVLRISKTGKLGMSKPCDHCIQQLLDCTNVRIKNVYYSNRQEGLTCVKFYNLVREEKYISRAFRN